MARNWSVFRVEQTSGHVQGKESVDVDALGGAAALELASVVPTVEMNCPVPFAELCHLRQCCRDLRTCMGDLKERFKRLSRIQLIAPGAQQAPAAAEIHAEDNSSDQLGFVFL